MNDTLKLAQALGESLLERQYTLVTAESCTGGGIARAVTDIPGSSQWFDCGFVTYSNQSKTGLLHVPETLIARHGAVSAEVARAMAQGALEISGCHIAVSTTGIAGPAGGTPEKPVGTVWFGFALENRCFSEHRLFSGDRHDVRRQSIRYALSRLTEILPET